MSYTKVVGWGPFRLPGESARRKAIEEAVAAVPRQEPAAPEPPAATETPEPQAAPATGPKHAAAPDDEQETAAPGQSRLVLDSSLNWRIAQDSAELSLPENFASLIAVVPDPDDSEVIRKAVLQKVHDDETRKLEYLKDLASVHLAEVLMQIKNRPRVSESQLENLKSAVSEYQSSSSFQLKLFWAEKLQEAARGPVRHEPLLEASTEVLKTVRNITRLSSTAPLIANVRTRTDDPPAPSRLVVPPITIPDETLMRSNLQRQFDVMRNFASTLAMDGSDEEWADFMAMVIRLRVGPLEEMREVIDDLNTVLKAHISDTSSRYIHAQATAAFHQVVLLEHMAANEDAQPPSEAPAADNDETETNDSSETRTGGRR